MEGGRLVSGDPHDVADPFDNRAALPRGARKLGQWAVDLGPGILYRKLVRLADRDGHALAALSETIVEDRGTDRTSPAITRVRVTRGRLTFRVSEDALVRIRVRGRREPRVVDARAGPNSIRARRPLRLWATDAFGNRSRTVRR
jgi:hypothetical protein